MTGDSEAAFRYTECKAHRNLNWLLDKESDVAAIKVPTYDDKGLEYYFMLAKIPLGMLVSSNNISIGKKVDIPSHNINEIIDISIEIIRKGYQISLPKAMNILKGPEHRLYACNMLIDEHEWKGILKYGKGKVQAEHRIEVTEDGFNIIGIPTETKIEKTLALLTEVNAKYNIATEINDLSDSKGLLIEVEFKTLRGKEKVVAEKFISEFIRRGRTNIFYNFYVCKQIANQAPNLSETATFRTEQIGLIEYLVDFQERRKHYKMKALFIRIEKLKFEIEVEELRLIIAKDIDKFIKLVQSSDSNKNAFENVAKAYKTKYEIAERVVSSSFTSYVNKNEKILKELERLQKELEETQWKINNIDGYLVNELIELKDKIGFDRVSTVTNIKTIQ